MAILNVNAHAFTVELCVKFVRIIKKILKLSNFVKNGEFIICSYFVIKR